MSRVAGPVTGGGTVLLTGGLGGAHLAPALADALGPGRLTVVVNVGDDLDWHGLRVCPDLDTVLYAASGRLDRARGWGLVGETFQARAALERLGEDGWFGVGDRDLATHLLRTERLRAGALLTEVTAELARHLGVRDLTVLPASDVPCPTTLELASGRRVGFQQWYVGAGAVPPIRRVVVARGPAAPAVLAALARADAVVLGPSNPVTSIGAILGLGGVVEALSGAETVVAVSPTVVASPPPPAVEHHARARRGVLAASGDADTPAGVAASYARRYPGLVGSFVLDEADAADAAGVAEVGLRPVIAPLLEPPGLAAVVADLVTRRPGATRSTAGTRAGAAPGRSRRPPRTPAVAPSR
jgi:LPPG:FO 2-phospho-L-lactate transferase